MKNKKVTGFKDENNHFTDNFGGLALNKNSISLLRGVNPNDSGD